MKNNNNLTVNEFAEYFRQIKSISCKATTAYAYEQMLKPFWKHFANRRINDIEIIDIDNYFLTVMQHPTHSQATKRDHIQAVLHVLRVAFKKQMLKNDIARFVTLPRFMTKENHSLTETQLQKIFFHFQQLPFKYQLMTYLFCETGKRRGEILGLDWKDIDFEKQTISIRQNYTYVPHQKPMLTTTKSNKKSVCSISKQLTSFLYLYKSRIELLAEQKNTCLPAAIFVNEKTFKRMHPTSITRYYGLKKDLCAVNKLSPHLFRHTVASILLAHGATIKEVAIQLDHSNPAFTLKQYIHSTTKDTTKKNNLILQRLMYSS